LWPLVIFVALAGLSDGISGLVVGVVEVGARSGNSPGASPGGLLFDLQGDYLVAFSLAAGLTFASIDFMWAVRLIAGEAHY
jgi:hypothetical protein